MSSTDLTILTTVVTIEGTTRLNVVALHNKVLVGSCFIEGWDLDGGCISFLFVPEKHRRQGIARQIMEYCLQQGYEAKKAGLCLTVNQELAEAKAFYERLGFQVVFTYQGGVHMMSYTYAPSMPKPKPRTTPAPRMKRHQPKN